ncbi:hypothetical protein BX265_4113 [Streptomyces sp. TLI_235]|nr:hypothetical protein BX265_4113 [Streptomyces sp. TLI_235]
MRGSREQGVGNGGAAGHRHGGSGPAPGQRVRRAAPAAGPGRDRLARRAAGVRTAEPRYGRHPRADRPGHARGLLLLRAVRPAGDPQCGATAAGSLPVAPRGAAAARVVGLPPGDGPADRSRRRGARGRTDVRALRAPARALAVPGRELAGHRRPLRHRRVAAGRSASGRVRRVPVVAALRGARLRRGGGPFGGPSGALVPRAGAAARGPALGRAGRGRVGSPGLARTDVRHGRPPLHPSGLRCRQHRAARSAVLRLRPGRRRRAPSGRAAADRTGCRGRGAAARGVAALRRLHRGRAAGRGLPAAVGRRAHSGAAAGDRAAARLLVRALHLRVPRPAGARGVGREPLGPPPLRPGVRGLRRRGGRAVLAPGRVARTAPAASGRAERHGRHRRSAGRSAGRHRSRGAVSGSRSRAVRRAGRTGRHGRPGDGRASTA